ncbi:hypothetical protein MMPV_001900 [Pyropia vietnamensis]
MASSPSTAFAPPPLATRRLPGSASAAAAKAPPSIGGSSFTPGLGAEGASHPAAAAAVVAHPTRPRMMTTPGSLTATAWAAAALRAEGGVDPATHHVTAVLRRARGTRDDHVAYAEEHLASPADELPATSTASVMNVATNTAVHALVAAQTAPAALTTQAPKVSAMAVPASGEWARRQASLSRHVAARWAMSSSPSESTPSPDLRPQGDSPLEAAAARLVPRSPGQNPFEMTAEASPPSPPPDSLSSLLFPPQAQSPLTTAASLLDASASGASSLRAAMDPPPHVRSLLYPPAPKSPVEDAASRLGSSEAYTPPSPSPPPPPSPAVEEKPLTLGEYLNTPIGSSPLESAAAVLARSARLAPTGKAAMEVPPPLAQLLDAPPSPDSPLEIMAATLIPPELEAPPADPEYPPEAYVDWDRAPPLAATPLQSSANVLERAAALDPSGRAGMEIPPPLAQLLDAPPDLESPLQEVARRIVEGRAGDVPPWVAAAADDEGSEEAEEMAMGADEAADKPTASADAAVDPSAALSTPPLGGSPLDAAAAVLARSARLAPTGKAAMEVPPPLATLLAPPPAYSPLTEAAKRLAVHDKVKEVVDVEPRRLDVLTTTRTPVPAPLSSPEEVKELLAAPPARTPLTMAADRLALPSPVSESTSELESAARRAATRDGRRKAPTGAPVVSAVPQPLPTFVTAALTDEAEPSAADVAQDEPAPIRDSWRAVVPPALTIAFVGACLALSQAASAVMDAGVPLH